MPESLIRPSVYERVDMRWRSLVLVVLVVLAGCSGIQFDDDWTDGGTTTVDPAGTSQTADREARGESVDRDNPWGESTLTVAVENAGAPSRNFTAALQTALGYWERNSEQYAGYPIEYELDPDAENPDLVVRFVDEVDSCPNVEHAAGCAPYVTDPAEVDRPMNVDVDASFGNESTALVLKHELGHTLGLDHDSAPQSIMTGEAMLATAPRRDATERPLPWADSELTVYLGPTPDRDRAAVHEQVSHALAYYADGAAGTVPSNVTFEFTRFRSEADVVVRFPDDLQCTAGTGGSCGSVRGVDPDRDDALEEYQRLNVSIAGVDTEAVGWYVGYWLGYGMGLDEEELAPPLQDDSYRNRRSDWWE